MAAAPTNAPMLMRPDPVPRTCDGTMSRTVAYVIGMAPMLNPTMNEIGQKSHQRGSASVPQGNEEIAGERDCRRRNDGYPTASEVVGDESEG